MTKLMNVSHYYPKAPEDVQNAKLHLFMAYLRTQSISKSDYLNVPSYGVQFFQHGSLDKSVQADS
jgi:hypothetical protein